MTWDAVIKTGVLTAARQHTPTLHTKLVRWEHDPQAAGALHVELALVSQHDLLRAPREVNDYAGADIATDLEVLSEVQVQIKVQALDLSKFSVALGLANTIRDALFTRQVQTILTADTVSDTQEPRAKLVSIGALMSVGEEVNGAKAKNWIFDAKFRVKRTLTDPEDGDTLESVSGSAEYDIDGDGLADITNTFEVPEP